MPLSARPVSIRVRLNDAHASGAVALPLPPRNMRLAALAFGIFFAIFAAIEWVVVSGLFRQPVEDVFDLTFLLFHGFWAIGWFVAVALLGGLTVLFAFYSESARLEEGRLVHGPSLGPVKIILDYELGRIRNVRLEHAGSDPDTVRVRFDYDGAVTTLGDSMPRAEGQRIVDAMTASQRLVPRAIEAPHAARQAVPSARAVPVRTAPAASSASAIALLAANAVPLAGVWFPGWDLKEVMLLYWVESGVVAFYTVLKIAVVGKLAALVAAPFFAGHFGGFMTGHFLLIYALFLREISGVSASAPWAELYTIFAPIRIPIAALFASHGISFVTNFIREREYAGATVSSLMTAPYQRVMVMHLTLIFGGWVILLAGTPGAALVVLVLLKTAVDLHAHRREHAGGDDNRAVRRRTLPSPLNASYDRN